MKEIEQKIHKFAEQIYKIAYNDGFADGDKNGYKDAIEEYEEKQKQTNTCGDKRFEIIKKAKDDILKATNIEDSEDEMKCLDNFLFRCWQMDWLKKYENQDVYCNNTIEEVAKSFIEDVSAVKEHLPDQNDEIKAGDEVFGYEAYKDIRETLVDLTLKGYTSAMIKTVLDQMKGE